MVPYLIRSPSSLNEYYYLLFFLFFRNEELPRDFRLKENAFQMTTFIFDDIRAKTEKRLELVRMVRGDFLFLGKRQFCEKASGKNFLLDLVRENEILCLNFFRKIFRYWNGDLIFYRIAYWWNYFFPVFFSSNRILIKPQKSPKSHWVKYDDGFSTTFSFPN